MCTLGLTIAKYMGSLLAVTPRGTFTDLSLLGLPKTSDYFSYKINQRYSI